MRRRRSDSGRNDPAAQGTPTVDLVGLDDVGWADLSHAYGAASDVPDLLRDLASDDPERRKSSLWELYGNIWHQGTVYEATAHAVPFLVRIATTAGVPDRARILELLAAISSGSGYV